MSKPTTSQPLADPTPYPTDGKMSAEDWRRFDELTDEEIAAAAATDPETWPPKMTPGPTKARRVSLARFVRMKLGYSREAFAAAYGIPLDTLTAWERHEATPSPVEEAYLKLIERAPEAAKVVVPVAAK